MKDNVIWEPELTSALTGITRSSIIELAQGMGYAVMGTATASGSRRAIEAAQRAIASPLLEAGAIDGARGILINITGSSSLKLTEVNEASTIIQSAAHEDANIIFGAVLDDKMKDSVKITVIATGFQPENSPVPNRKTETRAFAPAPPVHMPAPAPPPQMESAASEPERAAPAVAAQTFEADDLDTPAYLRQGKLLN